MSLFPFEASNLATLTFPYKRGPTFAHFGASSLQC